jgi:hypothetical protein
MNDASLHTYTMSDRSARDDSVRTYGDTVTEWLSENDNYEEEVAAVYPFEEEFLRSLSEPGDTVRATECSNRKHFKRRSTLVNFQDHISPVSTFGPSAWSYAERKKPILVKLRCDGIVQDEEG